MILFLRHEAWFHAVLAFLLVLIVLASRDRLAPRRPSGRTLARALWIGIAMFLLREGLLFSRIVEGAGGVEQLAGWFVAVAETGLAGFLLLSFRQRWFVDS